MDFDPADIGYMITLASVVIFLVSYPIGILVDRCGRRKTLIPGLLILGLSGYLLAQSIDPRAVYFMVVVYGIGSGRTTGTSQVYAMDLALERRRGAFLGIWSVFNLSSIVAPLPLGVLAETVRLSTAFVVVSVILAISAIFTWIFGPRPCLTVPKGW